jgi:hypothetical protein
MAHNLLIVYQKDGGKGRRHIRPIPYITSRGPYTVKNINTSIENFIYKSVSQIPIKKNINIAHI